MYSFLFAQFVVLMFWSIYIYDRELVYPKLLDNFIPTWLNHGMVSTKTLLFLLKNVKKKKSFFSSLDIEIHNMKCSWMSTVQYNSRKISGIFLKE